MSRIREFEPRQRDDQREARRSWPGSAWFVVGTMIVLNLLLGAFIVKTEIFGHGPAERSVMPKSVSPKIDVPIVNPRPELKPLQNLAPLPSQSPTRSSPVWEPKARGAKRAAITAALPRVTLKHYIPKRSPQARLAAPRISPSRTPAPVPAAVAAPLPSPGSGTVSTSPALVASIRTPAAGVRSIAETPQKVITPATAGSAARKTQPALNPKAVSNQKQVSKVASVGLPGMDKGLAAPKMAVGPLSPKLEIVHRPPVQKEAAPNCGGDVEIPCPTLHKRPSPDSPDAEQ